VSILHTHAKAQLPKLPYSAPHVIVSPLIVPAFKKVPPDLQYAKITVFVSTIQAANTLLAETPKDELELLYQSHVFKSHIESTYQTSPAVIFSLSVKILPIAFGELTICTGLSSIKFVPSYLYE